MGHYPSSGRLHRRSTRRKRGWRLSKGANFLSALRGESKKGRPPKRAPLSLGFYLMASSNSKALPTSTIPNDYSGNGGDGACDGDCALLYCGVSHLPVRVSPHSL